MRPSAPVGPALLVLLALAGSACDFDQAFNAFCDRPGKCPDGGAGGGGGSSTGGGGGSSTGGGGGATGGGGGQTGGGGGDAGIDSGVPDSGVVCPQTGHTLLTCAGPYTLSTAAASYPWMSSIDGRFVLGHLAGNSVQWKLLFLDGGTQASGQVPTASAPSAVAVNGRGDRWALSYIVASGDKAVQCATGQGTTLGSFSSAATSGFSDVATVAVDGDGGVGLSAAYAGGSTVYFASSPSGCPTGPMKSSLGWDVTVGTGAGHIPGAGLDGFRFLYSGSWFGPTIGYTGLYRYGADGGAEFKWNPMPGRELGDHVGVMSANGSMFISSHGENLADGGFRIAHLAQPTDLGTPGQPTPIDEDVRWWHASGCGDGCVATTYIHNGNVGSITVAFTSDDISVIPLGKFRYDVACNVAQGGVNLAIGWEKNKLGIVSTSPAGARLYICDRPF